MISPSAQSPDYHFLCVSCWAFVARRINMLSWYHICSCSVTTEHMWWVATLKQVLGKEDPARLVLSILPYVHSYCHLNWMGSWCLSSQMRKAAWPHMSMLHPTPAYSTFLYGCCDRMEQAGVGHCSDITPKASCGTQLTKN